MENIHVAQAHETKFFCLANGIELEFWINEGHVGEMRTDMLWFWSFYDSWRFLLALAALLDGGF